MSEMFRTALRGAICRWSQRNSQALELLCTQVAEEKGKTYKRVAYVNMCLCFYSPSYMVDMVISDTKRPCPVNLYGRLKSYILLLDIGLLQ